MKLQDVALIVLLLAGGIVLGFVSWTYVGPKLSSAGSAPGLPAA